MENSTEIRAALPARPTVLVAEDDGAVLEVTIQILEEAGLEVIPAHDGLEAVAIVKAEGTRIRVLVLDLMMPVMDGKTALREILLLQPDLPIVITSGLDGHQILGPDLASKVTAVYRKPYRMSEFVETVQRAVTGVRAEATVNVLQGDRSCG